MGSRLGRQIPVAMSRGDEREFLAFLRSSADIQIVAGYAMTEAELFPATFTKAETQFFLWNKEFDWAPEVAKNSIGRLHVSNATSGPVIEYDRWSAGRIGRLYWSKSPTLEGEFDFNGYPYPYDARRFSAWYDDVTSWVKSKSRTKGAPSHRRYYMPGAWWRGGFLSMQ